MYGDAPLSRDVLADLLVGRSRSRTRRALVLSAAYFLVGSGLAATVQGLPYEAIPRFAYGFQNAVLIATGFGQFVDFVFAPGLVVVVGLAAIHAALNAGYLTSLLLATAPVYPHFLFTVPGPATVPAVHVGEVVVAPVWAALHVLPNTVAFGTLGFVLGLALRHAARRRSATPLTA